jgi:lambda repressor-like predicted transcriptional regulator
MVAFDAKVELQRRINAAVSLRALARQWGVSPSRLCDALKGRRPIGEDLLKHLGYEVETTIVPRRKRRG